MRIGGWLSHGCVAAAAISGTLAFVWVQSGLGEEIYPGPFRSLPETAADVPAAVQSAVAQAFPIGTPELELIATVSQWGFVLHASDGRLRADYVAGGFLCTHYLSINWRADERERVSEVNGDSHLSCL